MPPLDCIPLSTFCHSIVRKIVSQGNDFSTHSCSSFWHFFRALYGMTSPNSSKISITAVNCWLVVLHTFAGVQRVNLDDFWRELDATPGWPWARFRTWRFRVPAWMVVELPSIRVKLGLPEIWVPRALSSIGILMEMSLGQIRPRGVGTYAPTSQSRWRRRFQDSQRRQVANKEHY